LRRYLCIYVAQLLTYFLVQDEVVLFESSAAERFEHFP